jgi:hypothetical protein
MQLRPGLIGASLCAAAILPGSGCTNATPPALPSLQQITEALTSKVDGTPTDLYARIARGALACWFGSKGPLKANHIYHAEAQPASQGGNAEIIVHERDRNSENQKGLRAFRIVITPDGDSSFLVIENYKLAEAQADSMEKDVRRWAAGGIGCSAGDNGWEPKAPETPAEPVRKPLSKKGRSA